MVYENVCQLYDAISLPKLLLTIHLIVQQIMKVSKYSMFKHANGFLEYQGVRHIIVS